MNNYNLLSVFDLLVDHNDKMFTKCNSVRNICCLESLYQITTIFATSWRNSQYVMTTICLSTTCFGEKKWIEEFKSSNGIKLFV